MWFQFKIKLPLNYTIQIQYQISKYNLKFKIFLNSQKSKLKKILT